VEGAVYSIQGRRIRGSDVLKLLGAWASFEEILADYPFLEREDILTALDHAKSSLQFAPG
jgi:uncharacterized protein (DUF433 family)